MTRAHVDCETVHATGTHPDRPPGWTDDDEHALSLWMRSKRLVRQITGADVEQYHRRMDGHINRRLDSVRQREAK